MTDCGEPLDINTVTGLALTAFASFAAQDAWKSQTGDASTSSSASTSPQPVAVLTIHSRKFVFLHLGSYLLVVQSVLPDSDAYLIATLRQIERLVYFHCGADFESVSNEPGVIDSAFVRALGADHENQSFRVRNNLTSFLGALICIAIH